jgi:hypothetical protein
MDSHNRGFISIADWALGLKSVMGIPGMPWESLVDCIAGVDEKGNVHYRKFLERYRIQFSK